MTLCNDLRMGAQVQILVLSELSLCSESEREHKTEMPNLKKYNNIFKSYQSFSKTF